MAEYQSTDKILPSKSDPTSKMKWRALVAYWILGLCNNFGYVVMLTAAHDIVSEDTHDIIPERNCTRMSTGVILLADIVPSLFVKLIAPFLPFFIQYVMCDESQTKKKKPVKSLKSVSLRVLKFVCAPVIFIFSDADLRIGMCVSLASLGYLLVAFSTSRIASIAGVVATSFCSGLGEVTLLQYSSLYDKNVVSTWSSGTGGAGIIGALSYSLLQALGFKRTFLIMLIVPLMMAVSFWIILPSPSDPSDSDIEAQKSITTEEPKAKKLTLCQKFKMIPGLFKYMVPLAAVYLFEYFINQGTFDLVDFPNTFLDRAGQYRWLQVDYQVGVFLSRSSVTFFHIKHIWILAVLQLVNVFIFTTQVIFYYIPSFWLVLALTLWEGVLGGAAYVNTFYKISYEVDEEQKHFSLGTTSFSDTIGITLAGFLAMLAHNEICTIPLPSSRQ